MKRSNPLKYIFLLLLIASLMYIPHISAHAATYPKDVACMSNVNIRSRASITSTLIARVSAGDLITLTGSYGNFYKVKVDGKSGYAQKSFVDGTDPSPDPSISPDLLQTLPDAVSMYPYDTVTLGYVKLRKKASETGDVIEMLVPGVSVTILELTSNNFAKVNYNGKVGYAYYNYFALANIPAPTPVPTPTPIPGSEKYELVKKGSTGPFVLSLQEALIELKYLDDKADGSFGANTEKALLTFQKRNGLKQNGIADAQLQLLIFEKLPKDYNGYRQDIKALPPISNVTIEKNSTGDAVAKLQERLSELGYYEGESTRTFDKDTQVAYSAFEHKQSMVDNQIILDGIAPPLEIEILHGATAISATAVTTPTPAPVIQAPTDTVRRGDEGVNATRLQQRLFEMGYYTGKITGIMNKETEQALIDFQKTSKLTSDGVCGPETIKILFSQNAIYAVPTPIPVIPEITPVPLTEETVVIITAGSRGDHVLNLQIRLQELGYYTSRQDGVFLSDDMTALQTFQRTNGLDVDGKAGIETQTSLYSDTAIRGNVVTTPSMTATLRYGSVGEDVRQLQNRLISLGYLSMTSDGKYGVQTKNAVVAFQKANSLTVDGIVGANTLSAINDSNAVKNEITSSSILKIGSEGEGVMELQRRLITLGYLIGNADGKFGLDTSLALIAFQKNNKLTADGVAGSKTLKKLNSPTAINASGEGAITTTSPAPSITTQTITASMVKYGDWYTVVRDHARLFPNVTVYDFVTGISWQVKLTSFGAHADGEPMTKEETAKMNRAFGGETTWTPKPVWVVFSDGSVYMATTHNVPHESNLINVDNDFDGHLCIHFPRTHEQVNAIGPYATSHQTAVELGWQATQSMAN